MSIVNHVSPLEMPSESCLTLPLLLHLHDEFPPSNPTVDLQLRHSPRSKIVNTKSLTDEDIPSAYPNSTKCFPDYRSADKYHATKSNLRVFAVLSQRKGGRLRKDMASHKVLEMGKTSTYVVAAMAQPRSLRGDVGGRWWWGNWRRISSPSVDKHRHHTGGVRHNLPLGEYLVPWKPIGKRYTIPTLDM
ncbi:hypothetical protein P153DRAFT_211922 [Dothidotthia symphoricarpi CBS 119687]|uniref:Uncharacterized protein n=1 Tax=Dothidotthia symphoricarpi CBS 119687 TaxID=1392245 RepID=A0A6A6AJR5_9PLEO|nr:uncharacterized protein P153DRAFT_211922 [Dothidotthia symphoricarpi CBS 119687]KAF2131154.1 hypothetical protein P153DRAFT_211922 [Dothidotthia symphoricarpi CBS 119687]